MLNFKFEKVSKMSSFFGSKTILTASILGVITFAFLLVQKQQLSNYEINTFEELTKEFRQVIRKVTGLDQSHLESWWNTSKIGRPLGDLLKLSQQMAHLPLATLSSITEPMIMLSRMDTIDGKMSASGQVGKAIVRGVKKDIAKFNQFVERASGKKVKGFADMQDEYWQEAYKVGLAIEQGVMAHFEGLYGEAAKGGFKQAAKASATLASGPAALPLS